MLIEEYIGSVKYSFEALEFLNEFALNELGEHLDVIKEGGCKELVDEVRIMLWCCSILIKYLQDGREEMRQKMTNEYHALLKTEP